MAVRFASLQKESSADSEESEEYNQFQVLCDGVESSLALVQDSLQQFIDLKDLLLMHRLPPNVLLRVSIVAGNIFRSLSDLKIPTVELIRIVRVFSSPWEQKSAALKRLHENYERKSLELNIALRKLAMQEAEIAKVNRESCIQNWARLFSRVQTTQGHGRRWKFRMLDFKKKAGMGVEHLREYFNVHNESDEIQNKVENNLQSEDLSTEQQVVNEKLSSLPETFEGEILNQSTMDEDLEVVSHHSDSCNDDRDQEEEIIPIETEDKGIQAGDIGYLSELQITLHPPELMKDWLNLSNVPVGSKVECSVYYAGMQYTAQPLTFIKTDKNTVSKPGKSSKMALKWRTTDVEKKPQTKDENKKEDEKFTTLSILIPTDVITGMTTDEALLQFQIHVHLLTPPGHTGPVPQPLMTSYINMNDLLLSNVEVVYTMETDDELLTQTSSKEKIPTKYLLHPLGAVELNAVKAVGQLPLYFMWRRTQIKLTHNRATSAPRIDHREVEVFHAFIQESRSDATQSEQLVMKSASVSPRVQTPQAEMISKALYDDLANKYEEKLEQMQKEYEAQIVSLSNEIQTVLAAEEQATSANALVEERGSSAFSLKSSTKFSSAKKIRSDSIKSQRTTEDIDQQDKVNKVDKGVNVNTEISIKLPRKKPILKKEKFNMNEFLTANKTWPTDFLDRLEFFNEMSAQHKQELELRIHNEVAHVIEQRLAEAYKLVSRNPAAAEGKDIQEDLRDAIKDVSLPALFMPQTNATGTVYNPRAYQYFHPIGLKNLRLCQAPSVFQLPPIKPQQVSVLNMFDMTRKISSRGQLNGMVSNNNNNPPQHQQQSSYPQQTNINDRLLNSAYTSALLTTPGPTVTMVSITHKSIDETENESRIDSF